MSQDLLLGAHTSAAGGVHKALAHGREIGASTIQLFTNNQKQWHSKDIPAEEVSLWKKGMKDTGISHVMSHDSYLINLGSCKPEILTKSRKAFQEEIKRCHLLHISYLNFHPGAATEGSVEQCLDTIVESLLETEELVSKGKTRLLLETTAGQGTSVGHSFEQLEYILKQTKNKVRLGVCIDTCHIFAAGYDIRTNEAWKKTLQQFDETVGLNDLYAFHLNDSLKDLGSRVDRHAELGKGKIGLEAFRFVMRHPDLKKLPKYLETPDPSLWKEEINMLRTFAKEKS